GDRLRHFPGGPRRRAYGDNDVHPMLDEVPGERGEPIELAVGEPPFDDEVAALDISQVAKSFGDQHDSGYPIGRRGWRRRREETQAVDSPRLLRLGGGRRGQRPKREPAEERSPVHSMT